MDIVYLRLQYSLMEAGRLRDAAVEKHKSKQLYSTSSSRSQHLLMSLLLLKQRRNPLVDSTSSESADRRRASACRAYRFCSGDGGTGHAGVVCGVVLVVVVVHSSDSSGG